MTEWYYGEAGAPQGPVSDADLQAKFASGAITGETLVWCDGMADWKRYADVFLASPSGTGDDATLTPIETSSPNAPPPPPASAAYSPYATPHTGLMDRPRAPGDPMSLVPDDYHLRMGDYLGGGWATLSRNFWPCLGACLVILMINGIASQLLLPAFFLTYPLMGGLFAYLLMNVRQQPAPFERIFDGFKSGNFAQLALMNLVHVIVMLVIYSPLYVLIVIPILLAESSDSAPAWLLPAMAAVILIAVPLGLYVGLISNLSMILCIDKALPWWPATKVAWKTVNRHWFMMMLTMFVFGLVIMAGMIACYIGMFVTIPWVYLAICCLYEDVFNRNTPPAPASP